MKKILYTTTAFILFGLAQSQAACIATPSCTSLGYASTTSCTDGLKCPFGNYWYCPSKTTQDECSGYLYYCTGTGYSGGSGTSCSGRYKSCVCASGYEWTGGACTQKQCTYTGYVWEDPLPYGCDEIVENATGKYYAIVNKTRICKHNNGVLTGDYDSFFSRLEGDNLYAVQSGCRQIEQKYMDANYPMKKTYQTCTITAPCQ